MIRLLIPLVLLMAACSPPSPPPAFEVIPAGTVEALFDADGIQGCSGVPDSNYLVPTSEWLEAQLAGPWMKYAEANLRKDSALDCDDWVRECVSFLYRAYRESRSTGDNTGLAIGEFHFERDITPPIGHAVVAAIIRTPEGLTRVYYEPQTGQKDSLSWFEETSCWLRKF